MMEDVCVHFIDLPVNKKYSVATIRRFRWNGGSCNIVKASCAAAAAAGAQFGSSSYSVRCFFFVVRWRWFDDFGGYVAGFCECFLYSCSVWYRSSFVAARELCQPESFSFFFGVAVSKLLSLHVHRATYIHLLHSTASNNISITTLTLYYMCKLAHGSL